MRNFIGILTLAFLAYVQAEACPEGWQPFSNVPNKCFYISSEKKLWTDAKEYCESSGGKLFMPKNANEETPIWEHIKSTGDNWLSIDATALDINNPLRYTQSNGQELEYTNWMPGRPKYENSMACMGIQTDGTQGWADFRPENQVKEWPFVCEKTACPEGWQPFSNVPNKCFKISSEKKLWTDAKDHCESIGGKLFAPKNAIEEKPIWEHIQSTGDNWLSIDAVALDENSPLDYTQSNGQELEYTNWMPGRPENENSMACMGIQTDGTKGWADFRPENQVKEWPFVCEKTVGNDCFEEDIDYKGNNVINMNPPKTDTAEECQALCNSTPECNFFTYIRSNTKCWMKKKAENRRHFESAVSGPKKCD